MARIWLGRSISCAAILALAALASGDALAQGAPAPTDTAWVKVCQTDPATQKELCIVTQEIRAETGQFIASATLRQFTGEDKISFIAAVPVGMLLQPGVRVQVDDQSPTDIKYGICFANACFGEQVISPDFIAMLKKGNKLIISALNQQGKAVNFPMSLIGFTKIFDGPGLDPSGAQQQQDKLNEVLKQRAEEARKRLIEQQQQLNGGAK